MRSQDIDVQIDGEVARTRTRTTYFNGSDSSVEADLRVAIPAGAILSRVARRVGSQESDAELRIGRPPDDADAKADFLQFVNGTPFRYLDAGPLINSRTVERLTLITGNLGRQLQSYPRMNWRLLTQRPESVAAAHA